jgi:regulator of protease activity HflC (stomatin/prohibitin superfamily)
MEICISAFLLTLVVFLLAGFRIAQEYERGVVFTLGRYTRVAGPGLYWIVPLFQWATQIDLRIITAAIEPQDTITRDSVTIRVNAVLWYKVNDPQKAIIEVKNYALAVNQAALTCLRNIIGQHDLDEILRERDRINQNLRRIVDEATELWGVTVEAIEMKDVEIPASMQRAMAQEAEAMREKRARLIKAQAELEASEKLASAAQKIIENPAALELRRMQMIAEVGAEHNSTTVMLIPSDFVNLANSLSEVIKNNAKTAAARPPVPVPPPPPPVRG